MSVLRINKTKDYSIMSNHHLKNKNLSLKAKGLLSVMLSLPDDWSYSIEGLTMICKENETAIKTALGELKEEKYLIVNKLMPNETKSGRIEYVYDIYEKPYEEKQESEKQGIENLGLENLGLENPIQINNNNLYNNKLNTKEENTNNKNNKLIKEIQKEKTPLEIVFEHWNSKEIIKHKQITKDIEKAYEKASKELKLSTEDIKLAIDRYNEVLKAEGYYFKYKWSLAQFLSRGLGIKEFLDEGSKWVNYIDWKNKNGKTSLQPHYKPSKAKAFNPDIDKVEEINVNLDVDI